MEQIQSSPLSLDSSATLLPAYELPTPDPITEAGILAWITNIVLSIWTYITSLFGSSD